MLFARDLGIFVALPLVSVLFYSMLTSPATGGKRQSGSAEFERGRYQAAEGKSQILEFGARRGGGAGKVSSGKRAPGGLVRVRLMNVVETYGTAPVHAQILDAGLGAGMRGGVLIGDATPDTNFERISISFRFARDPVRDGVAIPITARALSLDGTLGLPATKKEGFFVRSALGSASSATQAAQGKLGGSADLGQILLRALTAGLSQEFGSATQVERNRAQVLVLQPAREFFAELTDFYGAGL